MIDVQKFEGKVQEIPSLIGTPRVDASEIVSVYPGAYEAVQLLNQISPDSLRGVAFIYKSDDPSAYGVFNPTLNKSLHVIEVEKELKDQGFDIKIDNNNNVYASAPNMTKEQISEKMKYVMQQKEKEGGIAFGINPSAVTRASDEMIAKNSYLTPEQQSKLRIAVCASVMAHEAEHAKGDNGETGPYAKQSQVLQRALAEFKIEIRNPVEIHANSSGGWYRRAQMGTPFLPFRRNVGIESVLRMNQEKNMRIFPVKGKKDDSVETLLEKNQHEKSKKPVVETKELEDRRTEGDFKVDPPETLESILNENRAHPLIILFPKAASSNMRTAGWGSNIGGYHVGGVLTSQYLPGSSEGAWISPFSAEEIRDKTYTDDDANTGFSFWMRRYDRRNQNGHISVDSVGNSVFNDDVQINLASMEFRNNPMRWEDRDPYWPNRPDIAVSGASNSSAYNVKEDTSKNFIVQILKLCGYYKNLVRSGKRNAARLVVSKEALPHVVDAVSDIQYSIFENGDKFSVWVYQNTTEDKVAEIERDIIEHKNSSHVNEFVNLNADIKERVNKIMSKCKLLCEEHGIHDTYVVGGFVRTLAGTKNFAELNDLDFSSSRPDDCLKLGGLLAADLGIYDIGYHHKSKTMTFEYEGIKMDFRGNYSPFDIRPMLRQKGIETTPLNFDIYARDFTINSLVYSFMENKIYDVTGQGMRDLQANLIRTYFDPEFIVPLNPLVITRAIILSLKGFVMSKDLDLAIHRHSESLFNGKESKERLAYEYEKIVGYGDAGIKALEDYNLTRLKRVRDEVEAENPQFFKKE